MFVDSLKEKINNNEKNKEIALNSFFSMLIKGIGFIVSFISMPLYIKYFKNQAVLGIWFTIISLISWIFTFDLGLGNGLRNSLVIFIVKKDFLNIKKYISSAYAIITILVVIIGIIGGICINFLNWNEILNIEKNIISNDILKISINILFIGVLISFILKLINSILYAMQKSAVNNAISLFTSIIPLIYLLVVPPGEINHNFINLSIVNVVANCIPVLIANIYIFAKPLKQCLPSIKNVSKQIGIGILKFGSTFFIVQIAFMILVSTNEIIITNFFGAEQVVEYQIYYRIFFAIGTVFSLFLAPMWSAVTKAIAENDFLWIKKLKKSLYRISIIATSIEIIGAFFLQFIVNIWLKENAIEINFFYAFIFAIYGSIFIFNIVSTTIANGIGKLKVQLYCYIIGDIIKLPLIIILKMLIDSWIVTILANIIILLAFCIIQNINLNKYIKNEMS